MFALLKTFWPRRSLALPTAPLPSDAPFTAAELAARLEQLQEATLRLETRLARMEQELRERGEWARRS